MSNQEAVKAAENIIASIHDQKKYIPHDLGKLRYTVNRAAQQIESALKEVVDELGTGPEIVYIDDSAYQIMVGREDQPPKPLYYEIYDSLKAKRLLPDLAGSYAIQRGMDAIAIDTPKWLQDRCEHPTCYMLFEKDENAY